jgi:hypothetical protein
MKVMISSVSYQALTEALSSGTLGEDERPGLGAGVAWHYV